MNLMTMSAGIKGIKDLFDIVTALCKVITKKRNQSYLSKLFKILLHIFHYCIGRQATHKYFLCSCDHLEKRGQERRR